MSLWKYKYFVDVIDSKSFTKAGKKNFVSQTAISQQINEEMLREIKRYKGRSKFELGVDCSLSRIFWKKVEKMLDVYYSETEALLQMNRGFILKVHTE